MPDITAVSCEPAAISLRADQIERWHRGERRLVEDYLVDQPELRTDEDAVLDLIYSEVVIREELGEAPDAEEYLRRFPQLDAALRRQFAVHRLLESPSLQRSVSNTPGPRPGSLTIPDVTELWSSRAASGPPSVPGYEILGELGRGGMGVVYKARQTKLNRVVALKLIGTPSADVSARFRTEAEMAARLQHPNIVQIHECGECGAGPYVALEYVDGNSLARKIGGTPLPPRDAAALLLPLARAMHYAHGNGIVHRDLKPANILLAACGVAEAQGATPQAADVTPKIADFGLAKCVDADSGQTKSGAVLGTPSYMAPEQAAGHSREVGLAADVYALGAILYEMLTGRPPFKAATAMETMQQVVADEPVPPRRLQSATPRDLETICLKCLRKEPNKRYASAQDLAGDLERYLAAEPIRARPVSSIERTVKWARRRPAGAALVLLTVTATVGALVAWAAFTGRLEQEKTEARRLQRLYETERDRAIEQGLETRRQRDEAVRLLEIGLAAVRDHARVVVQGKQSDLLTENPGEVLFQLACAYARSSEAFRKDAGLAPDHARRLSDEYADSAMTLLKAASQIGFFSNDMNCNCQRLNEKPELQLLKGRREFKQLSLPKGRG
jgi:serine/threonine protein kinase